MGKLSDELHAIGVTEDSRHLVEGADPRLIQAGLLTARDKSWDVFQKIRPQMLEGLTELDARKVALSIFSEYGVKKHWHQPYIRFGSGTQLTFHEPLRSDYRLQKNDPVYMDFGPVWEDLETGIEYEGDVGDSFVFGKNIEAEHCIQTARKLFAEAKEMWAIKRCSGKELYAHLDRGAKELGYKMVENVLGHRVSDFPHHQYSKRSVIELDFHPNSYLWILELQIVHPELPFGAFFEDLLY